MCKSFINSGKVTLVHIPLSSLHSNYNTLYLGFSLSSSQKLVKCLLDKGITMAPSITRLISRVFFGNSGKIPSTNIEEDSLLRTSTRESSAPTATEAPQENDGQPPNNKSCTNGSLVVNTEGPSSIDCRNGIQSGSAIERTSLPMLSRPYTAGGCPEIVLCNAKRSILRHLKRPERKVRLIPFEIILEICDYLDEVTIILLALTCREFHRRLLDTNHNLRGEERERFLLLLEKDLPNLMYCHKCNCLHNWKNEKRGSTSSYLSVPNGQPMGCKAHSITFSSFSIGGLLYFSTFRLVMKRALYGPLHGFPTSVLDFSEEKLKQRGISVKRDRRAKIIDAKMFIRYTYSVFTIKGDVDDIWDYVTNAGETICQHAKLRRANFERQFIRPFQRQEVEPRRGPPIYHFVGLSCPQCLTDYHITRFRCGDDEGPGIKVTTYQNLGSCRSHRDWAWEIFRRETYQPQFPLRWRSVSPGEVERDWTRSETNMISAISYVWDMNACRVLSTQDKARLLTEVNAALDSRRMMLSDNSSSS